VLPAKLDISFADYKTTLAQYSPSIEADDLVSCGSQGEGLFPHVEM
jgi:hypothetical protein